MQPRLIVPTKNSKRSDSPIMRARYSRSLSQFLERRSWDDVALHMECLLNETGNPRRRRRNCPTEASRPPNLPFIHLIVTIPVAINDVAIERVSFDPSAWIISGRQKLMCGNASPDPSGFIPGLA